MKISMCLVAAYLVSSSVNAAEINLDYGDVHLNEWTGTFATKLDGPSRKLRSWRLGFLKIVR
jgi:hypothetical protein